MTALSAAAPPAVGIRPAADGSASAPCRPTSRSTDTTISLTDATSRLTAAPAIATAPRVTTDVLPSAGR
ncbi:hypothetical protein [Streptomyces platensis]|uniref:hypothetical protein n=1 Tax=Streptomyces platensis TaxID=58346 RepID=UPI001F4075DA|nr:hypothetical protein [Streptomyces platensis]MCF3148208.1 hypothetical protein [Streptomyces platensis]